MKYNEILIYPTIFIIFPSLLPSPLLLSTILFPSAHLPSSPLRISSPFLSSLLTSSHFLSSPLTLILLSSPFLSFLLLFSLLYSITILSSLVIMLSSTLHSPPSCLLSPPVFLSHHLPSKRFPMGIPVFFAIIFAISVVDTESHK